MLMYVYVDMRAIIYTHVKACSLGYSNYNVYTDVITVLYQDCAYVKHTVITCEDFWLSEKPQSV